MTKLKYYIENNPDKKFKINGFPDKVLRNLLFYSTSNYRKYYDRYLIDNIFEEIDFIPNDKFYYPILYFRVELNDIVDKHIDIPIKILNTVKSGQCKLLIQSPAEGWTYSNTVDPFIDSIILKYNLTDINFVILTGNYLQNPRFETVYFNTWELATTFHWNNKTPESIYKIRPYKYICLNRRPDTHRIAIATLLSQLEVPGILTLAKNGGYGSNSLPNSERDMFIKFPELENIYNKNIKPKIPLTFNDGIDPEITNPNFDDKVNKFHDSYLNITTETSFNSRQLFLSEKIFKPIIHYQPFVVVGNPGSLSLLKSLNYKTFDSYFDESYDDEKNFNVRLYKIFNIVKDFTNKSSADLTNLMIDMKPIFEHNVNNLKKRSESIIFSYTRHQLNKILYTDSKKSLFK